MRVIQAMAGANQGGAETFFTDMTIALHQAGLDQKIVLREGAPVAERLRQAGLDVVSLPLRGWWDWSSRRALRRMMREYQPDIVQTWMRRATELWPRRRAGESYVHVGWFGGYYNVPKFSACDHLVGVTRDIVTHMQAHGRPAHQTHYLPTLASDAPEPPVRRADFDTPQDAPLALALGRLHWKKGFDTLLDALAMTPGLYLWIAGEGPLGDELRAQTRRLGLENRVRFLGWRTDRGALLSAADLCIMPSRYEPFGTVMIEAWAYRCPLIAAAAAGPRSLIRDGENGLMVPIDDARALANAMRAVVEDRDLAARLKDAARAEYERDFTVEAATRRYLAFYEGLLAKR